MFCSFWLSISEFWGCFDKCVMLEFPKEGYKGTDTCVGIAFLLY